MIKSALVTSTIFAASFAMAASKHGYLVKADFQFENAKRSFQTKLDTILPEDNNSWTPLTPAVDGVALLGKLHKPNQGALQVEYMVVDTGASPVVVSQMSAFAKFGQSSTISSKSESGKMSVGIVVEQTTYTEKPRERD